ncbi:MAG: TonB-dependent receptor [Flavobacteriaceae bacterium]|nr:TonB-dependent receptor [Flavobacteriaceae bacterium]
MVELSINASHIYKVSKELKMEIIGGVKNILNAYQKDFDKTIARDSGYIYGPAQPRTVFVGIKFGTDL